MIRRAKLYARINQSGTFSRIAVSFNKNGSAIEPRPRKGSVTSYAVRVGGKFEHAGNDLHSAVTFLRQRQAMIGGGANPLAIDQSPSAALDGRSTPDRVLLSQAAEEYKAALHVIDKAKSTVAVYSNAIDGFLASCNKIFIDEIDRMDILNYIQWMRDHLRVRVRGGQSRTIKNRLAHLGVFLSKYGVKLKKSKGADASAPGLIFHDDRPKVVKKKPKKYDQETLNTLLSAADIDQKDYLMFLLWSGFRDEEVQYLQYSDFDWNNKTATVHAKPNFVWRPKDCEERTITLPSEVSKQMKDRMDRPRQYLNGHRKPSADDLVFPNSDGRPDSHLIKRLHAVAKKANLNLKGKQAGHMFRKTAGSRVAKKLGLRAAMDFLGHSDVETTALYLAADDSTSAKSRQAFEEMFQEGD
jgi:integrase